jgi:hypothetical protein
MSNTTGDNATSTPAPASALDTLMTTGTVLLRGAVIGCLIVSPPMVPVLTQILCAVSHYLLEYLLIAGFVKGFRELIANSQLTLGFEHLTIR